MDAIVNWLIGSSALACLLPYMDRLRSINWFTHQPRVVAMHLLMALWLGFVAYEALIFGDAPAYEFLSIGSAAFWLLVSWDTWRSGPPKHTASDPESLEAWKSS